eukprot:1666777-Rhodomonas_salina.1
MFLPTRGWPGAPGQAPGPRQGSSPRRRRQPLQLGKAHTVLTSESAGMANDCGTDDVALLAFQSKHPDSLPGLQTLGGREVPASACPAGAFDWLTRANLARVAATLAQGSATDQWGQGWLVREF